MLVFPIFASLLSIGYAALLALQVLREPKGDGEMQKIALAIQEGAGAYLSLIHI